MRIYTRTGDKGMTGLRGGRRVPKSHPRIDAFGEIDELNSALGAARSLLPAGSLYSALRKNIDRIQAELFAVGAVLSAAKGRGTTFRPGAATWLEPEIDRLEAALTPLRNFILPGGSPPGAALHLARTVCRRAERAVTRLPRGAVPAGTVPYLNRLSDYLFVAARWVNHKAKRPERRWRR